MREPNFDNILRILNRERPARPTLFEFYISDDVCKAMAGGGPADPRDELAGLRTTIAGYVNAGYDYAYLWSQGMSFPMGDIHQQKTLSLNDGAVICDKVSFQKYAWPDPDKGDYSPYERALALLPPKVKMTTSSPMGVLEITTRLVGFENLCVMSMTDPQLTKEMFDAVGTRLLRQCEIIVNFPAIGAFIINDDWGFKNQPMFAPDFYREYVFPWTRRMVQAVHAAGKPTILHSCGNLGMLMDEIIDDLKLDGKHSYEDTILPVEKAYEQYGRRIAIMGGIDVDFLVRHTPEEIARRSSGMLARSKDRGAYALGSGNSIPDYVPMANYRAMNGAALGIGG